MAVGDIYPSPPIPEQGWNSFIGLDRGCYVKYVGSGWGSNLYTFNGSDYSTFSFTGTGFRMIAGIDQWSATNIKVTIDGVDYIINRSPALNTLASVFELLDLPEGTHFAKLSSSGETAQGKHMAWGYIHLKGGKIVPTIGEPLTQPEEGWRRYDNISSYIKYVGAFEKWEGTSDTPYNGTLTWCYDDNAEINFVFYGTKIRMVSKLHEKHSNKVKITIDGSDEFFSEYNKTTSYQVLTYEKNNLTLGYHNVKLSRVQTGTCLTLDCFDIDSNGNLVHHTLQPNQKIYKLQVGEYINCNYSYANGFSNFKTGDDLNFICVKSNSKESILVSDTVIPNISFDELNQKGFIYGNNLIPSPFENTICTIRSISGGEENDGTSEYDKYIVDSNLNNIITPGDKNIWHWDLGTITSDTPITDNSKIVTRGTTAVNTHIITNAPTTKVAAIGFRPMLIIKHLYQVPSFNIYKFGECNGVVKINNIKLNPTIEDIKVKVKIINTDTKEQLLYTDLLTATDNSINVDINSCISSLNKVINLSFILEDINEYTSDQINISVFKHSNGVIIFNKLVSLSNTILNKSYEFIKLKAKYIGNIIGLYSLDDVNYKHLNINSIGELNSNSLYLNIAMDKDTELKAYKLIGLDNTSIVFNTDNIKDIPSGGTGGGSVNQEEIIKLINDTVNPKLDVIKSNIKDLQLSDIKSQFKYDKKLNIEANYTGNYYIDTKLDVEKEGE